MHRWKVLLWLAVLQHCASCTAAGVADTTRKDPLRLSDELNLTAPQKPQRSADKQTLAYEAGAKAAKEGDFVTAMSLLRPPADSGHAASQALLASILENSSFQEEALAYYRKSAEQGNPDGQFGLGMMYAEGTVVKQDLGEARNLIMSAAQRGQKPAIITVAQAYIKGGLGLDENALEGSEALYWIKRAVNIDNLPAIDALAAAYLSGKYGLTPDPKQAAILTAKADKLRGITEKNRKKKKPK